MTGPLRYETPTHLYRFLFADGDTIDILAARDDSDLRSWALEQHYGPRPPKDARIAGVANLPDQPTLNLDHDSTVEDVATGGRL